MNSSHEKLETLALRLERAQRELSDEIENQFNLGILIDECQPLKDRAHAFHGLHKVLALFVKEITAADFDTAGFKNNLEKIYLQRMLENPSFKYSAFARILVDAGVNK
jgi:hypothetical protein